MSESKRVRGDPTSLQRRAETLLEKFRTDSKTPVSESEVVALLHELSVYQNEFERQFNELAEARDSAERLAEKYSELYNLTPSGILTVTRRGIIREINHAGATMLRKPPGQMVDTPIRDIFTAASKTIFDLFLGTVFSSGKQESCELKLSYAEGLPTFVSLHGIAKKEDDHVLISMLDDSSRRQAELILSSRHHLLVYSESHTVQEFLQAVLDELEILTGSKIGFFHFLEADQNMLSLQAWSTNTMQHMCAAEGQSQHYPVDKAGVWVDCVRERRAVIHNDYSSLPHKKGMPEGHSEVIRELVVPVFRKNRIVAIVGIGNKPTDFTEEDAATVANLADLAWDIVERKMAEDALRTAQSFRQSIERSLQSGIAIVNSEGEQIYVNPSFCSMLGWTEQELLGKQAPFVYWPADQLDVISAAFEETMANLAPPDGYELVFCAKDGGRIPVQVIISPFNDGVETTGWLANVVDMRKRKEEEAELRKKDALLEITGQTAKVGGWEFDAETLLQTWTEEVYRIHELPFNSQQDVSSGIDFYTPESKPLISDAVERVVNNGEPFDLELEIVTAKGNRRAVRSIGRAYQENGVTKKVFGSIQDITESREVKLRMEQQNAELMKLNAEKDKFFSIIAHDLKSPFNSIVGFSSLLAEEVQNNNYDALGKFTEIILESSERAMDLLTNLMQWSRSQTGRIEFKPERLELSRLVGDVIQLLKNAAVQKSIRIENNVSSGLVVTADKEMIGTVLRNLVSNAIKFTGMGGSISINVEMRADGVTTSVRDSGVGIESDRLESLFYLADNHSTAGTDNEKGTGLGLILCKEFIERHNGTIQIESEVGKGSVFSFTIPGPAEELPDWY